MVILVMTHLGLFKIRGKYLNSPPPPTATKVNNLKFIQKEYIETVLRACYAMVGVVREEEVITT